MIEGEIGIVYGEKHFQLGPGDSVYYNAQIPHRLEAHKGARFLAVLYEAYKH